MQKSTVLFVIILFAFTSVALAVPAKKTIVFDHSPMGAVTFDGTIHKEAGNKCKDCHNEGMFPKMKQGTVTITMADIDAGKLCGVCHNGQRAFGTAGNCEKCHVKK